jgi:hypothetical protein
VTWGVYYSDGSVLLSDDTTPWGITQRSDVQVIVQKSADHNWVTLSGYDYYVWDTRGKETKWWQADLFGLHHYLLQPGYKCVLFGTMIDRDTFREIFDRARAEFGDKQIFAKDERRP